MSSAADVVGIIRAERVVVTRRCAVEGAVCLAGAAIVIAFLPSHPQAALRALVSNPDDLIVSPPVS